MAKYKVEISGINTNDIVVLKQEEMNELFKVYNVMLRLAVHFVAH